MTTDYPIYSTLDALSHLDDENFVIACSANEELQMICDGKFKPGHQKYFGQLTDYLFMRRCEAYFDKSLLKFKDSSVSWKDFYEQVVDLIDNIKDSDLAYLLIQKKKLLPLKILYKIKPNLFTDQNIANGAANYGNAEILDWLKEINLLPDQEGVLMAVENNNRETLKWIKENNIPFSFDQTTINHLSHYITLDTLKFLIENNLVPDQGAINNIVSFGNLEKLKFLFQYGLVPNQEGANIAAGYARLEILKWMKEKNLPMPDANGVYMARYNNYEHILKWLRSEKLIN